MKPLQNLSFLIMNFPTQNYRAFLFLCGLFVLHPGWVQPLYGQGPPARPEEGSVTLRGGTIHIGNGSVIENGHLTFEDGEITYIGSEDQEADRVIDVSGHHIYPGLIAPNTDIGLVEISAVRATRDYQEVGQYNPHVRALIAYNTDSKIIPTIRSNGVLLAEIAPQGGIISGQSAVVQFDAWNWEDARIRDTAGIHLYWPRVFSYDSKSRRYQADKDYEENVLGIEAYFQAARAYGNRSDHEHSNLRFEAISDILDRNLPVFVHADEQKAMMDAIDWAERLAIPIVLVGAEQSWKIAETLAEKEIPVIIASTQRLPAHTDAGIAQPFETPATLDKAGVLWCFSHGGTWDQRNLPFQAGQAVGFGLDKERAVQALTLSTARILGIDDRYGSLETGKSATLVICDGDILDPRSSIILQAFIDGREVDLDNKQKKLYRRFAEKYGIGK